MIDEKANYKYDRAIDLIRRIKTEETHERYIDRHKAFDLAISALEKQIRKKPNLWNGKITTCPNCLRAIRQTEALDVHCMYCGQFIDWSDME